MSSGRIKKYLMQQIPKELGGGYRAYFVGDDFSVDAMKELLPDVIEEGGMKISPGVAENLIKGFCKKCVNHTAKTGETVNIANLMTVMLAIKGSYERRKSTADKDNVRVIVRLLEEMRPMISFRMANALTAKVPILQSATSPGCDAGFVKQYLLAILNGLNLEMLEGDTVTAMMKNQEGEEVVHTCAYTSEGSTRLNVVIPEEFNAPEYAGKAITFKVTSRCGDPDSEQDSDTITVTLLAGDAPGPEPTPELTLTSIQTAGVQEGQVNETNTTSLRGQDNLYPWDIERDSVVVHFDGQELTVPDVEFSAGNETLQFQIPQRVGEVLDDDDTLSFTVTINGAVGTIDAVWKH